MYATLLKFPPSLGSSSVQAKWSFGSRLPRMMDHAAWVSWAEKYSRCRDGQRVLCLLQHWDESALQVFYTQHVGPNVAHICWIDFTKPCGKKSLEKTFSLGGGAPEEKLEHKSLFSLSVGFVHVYILDYFVGPDGFMHRGDCVIIAAVATPNASDSATSPSDSSVLVRSDPPSLSEQQSQEMTGFGGLTTCKSLRIIRRVWIFHFVFYRRISDYPGWRSCQIDRLGDCRRSAVINSCSTYTW